MCLQYPAPYKLRTEGDDAQLATIDRSFTVSPQLCTLICSAASLQGAYVYIQSNVEDVAVTMSERIEAAAAGSLIDCHSFGIGSEMEASELEASDAKTEASDRQDRWRALGGASAVGPGWMGSGLYPFARTETEAAYEKMDKTVFRKLWIRD